MPRFRLTPFQRAYLIAVLAALGLFLLHAFRLVNFYETQAIDLRLFLRGPVPAHEAIVLVEVDDQSLKAVGPWPWSSETQAALLEAIKRYEPELVLYDMFIFLTDTSEDSRRLALAMERAAPIVLPFLYHSIEPLDVMLPSKPLLQSARAVGFSNLIEDSDGHVRRIKKSIVLDEKKYYHLSLQALLAGIRDEEAAAQWLSTIPSDRQDALWINYPGPLSSFQRISASEILKPGDPARKELLAQKIRGKILLIGPTASAGIHLKPTAFSPLYPATAIHGSAIHTLLSGRYIRLPRLLVPLMVMIVLSLLIAWGVTHLRPRRMLFFTVGTLAGYVALSQTIFLLWGYALPLFMPLISTLLTYISLLFTNDIEMRFRSELMEHELDMAARLQETFLAVSPPNLEGIDVAFKHYFAKHVGGDFYDWIDLGSGRLAVAVGDVSGKGVPAAIYMARAISEFRRESSPERNPAEVLSVLNQLLANRTYAGMFLTMTYVIINRAQDHLSICSAGHEPVVHYDAQTGKASLLEHKKGPPVGVFTDAVYETTLTRFAQGDVILLFSDGVTELRNGRGVPLGTQGIIGFLEQNAPYMTASDLVLGLFRYMDEYRQEGPVQDDQTILAVKLGTHF